MSIVASSPPEEGFSGLVERVTFHSEETGFAVLRVTVKGYRELVTVVGVLPSVNAGEWITAQGNWVQDKQHGPQFKTTFLKASPPTSREGIEKYLASGLIKGIGPVYAKKLVEKFGEQILTVIDLYSAQLEEVNGIGPERRKKIKAAWVEQRAVREIMIFLHAHGVSTSRAVRIYKAYGEQAIETVRANPYTLAKDIYGIGFQSADAVAQKLGIPRDSMIRAVAGLRHSLLEATSDGHCALPKEVLQERAAKLLEIEGSIVHQALERLLLDLELVQESIGSDVLVYLPHLRRAEEGIAGSIARVGESSIVFAANRCRESHRLVSAEDGEGIGAYPAGRPPTSIAVPHHSDNGRSRGREDDLGRFGIADSPGKKSPLPALRSDWTRRETPGRSYGNGSQDYSPLTGVPELFRRLRPQRRASLGMPGVSG